MKPIVPAYILSDSIQIEQAPIGYGLANVYRGIKLVPMVKPTLEGSPSDSSGHPYRSRLPMTTTHEPIPVIVRVLQGFESYYLFYRADTFAQVARARWRLHDAGAPQLFHILGKNTTLLATVEEYLVGTSLKKILYELRGQGQNIPEPQALRIGSDLLSLWHAAVCESIHISLDLANVFIDDQGRNRARPKYRDEISRQEVGAALLTLNQEAAAASPEEIRGALGDERSAMFTFGMLLYELLTGDHPFLRKSDTLFETLSAILHHDAPFLRSKRPDIHRVVASFVHRCLARDPQRRFPNWDELRAAYIGMQSLFAPVIPEDIAQFALSTVATDDGRTLPFVEFSNELCEFRPYTLNILDFEALPEKPITLRVPIVPTKPIVDPEAEFAGYDGRPMLRVSNTLLVDARPVTKAEIERYFFATRQAIPPLLRALTTVSDDDACVLVTPEIAEAYAAWAGKRLPTEAEWELAATTLGPERLDIGRVWEWTATPYEHEGRIVRGGRWRDQTSLPPQVENRSFAINPAPDLGFRCVVSMREE